MRKRKRLTCRRYARFTAKAWTYYLRYGTGLRGILLGRWSKDIWSREEALEAAGAICDERGLVLIISQ